MSFKISTAGKLCISPTSGDLCLCSTAGATCQFCLAATFPGTHQVTVAGIQFVLGGGGGTNDTYSISPAISTCTYDGGKLVVGGILNVELELTDALTITDPLGNVLGLPVGVKLIGELTVVPAPPATFKLWAAWYRLLPTGLADCLAGADLVGLLPVLIGKNGSWIVSGATYTVDI